MIKIIDFSKCELSARNLQYGGRAGEKRGIFYNNEFWFLKFPKNTIGMNNTNSLSYVTSPLSEYIGSHIFEILGFDVHKTILGICFDGKRNKVVCACKDFINDDKNELLIPYTALRNDSSECFMERNENSMSSASNLNEIIFQLENNTILKEIREAKDRFWEVLVVDILINNNDRNEDNWGVIKFKSTNKYVMAPIFDNGNSFYSKTDDERIISILNDKERLFSSAANGVTAYESDDEKRLTVKNILNIDNEDLKISLLKIYNLFQSKMNEIIKFIEDIPTFFEDVFIISDDRKKYYIESIKIRLEMIKKTLDYNKN